MTTPTSAALDIPDDDARQTQRRAAELTPRVGGPPSASQLEAYTRLAVQVNETEFVPEKLRGRPAAVLASILTGAELGVGPMNAMQKLYVTDDGSIGQHAELMRAIVVDAGHRIKFVEYTPTKVTLRGWRSDETEDDGLDVTWTPDDALRAGLCDSIDDDGLPVARSQYGNPMAWEKYPRMMLLARATSELCRAVFPDVLAGISYTPDEIGAADVVDVTPEGNFVYGDAEAAEAEQDPDLPPPDVDPKMFRAELFRRYRDALEVARCHTDAGVLDERRVEALDGKSTVTPDELASDDPMTYGKAFAAAPLSVLRELVDDVESIREEVEADGRCGYIRNHRRCQLDPGHRDEHLPGDYDGPEPGDGLPADPEFNVDPDDGQDGDSDVNAGGTTCDDCGAAIALDEPHDCQDTSGTATVTEWDDATLATSKPDELVAAGAAKDVDEASHMIDDAQDRIWNGQPPRNTAHSEPTAPSTPSDGGDTHTHPPPEGNGAHNGSHGVPPEGPSEAIRDRFAEAVEQTGRMIADTPIPKVMANVNNGDWAASMVLAIERVVGQRVTLIPQLEDHCTPADVAMSKQLADWWLGKPVPRAVDEIDDVEPGTPAHSAKRQELGQRLNAAYQELRKADKEAAQAIGPKIADTQPAIVPLATLAAMVDDVEAMLADAQQEASDG